MSEPAQENSGSRAAIPRQTHDVGWDELVNALREELQEEGGLLRLVNQQTEILYRRDVPDAERIEEQIASQQKLATRCAQHREQILRQTAGRIGLSEEARTSDVLGCFPEYVQPLLEALVSEVNRLSGRVEERIKQNQSLKDRFFSRTASAA